VRGMFHAINTWLARQARRARDYRLARDNQIATANGWQVQRIAGGTYRYRDPRFDQRASAQDVEHAHGFDGFTYHCPVRDCWANRNQPGTAAESRCPR
jgi:hypothetical protein